MEIDEIGEQVDYASIVGMPFSCVKETIDFADSTSHTDFNLQSDSVPSNPLSFELNCNGNALIKRDRLPSECTTVTTMADHSGPSAMLAPSSSSSSSPIGSSVSVSPRYNERTGDEIGQIGVSNSPVEFVNLEPQMLPKEEVHSASSIPLVSHAMSINPLQEVAEEGKMDTLQAFSNDFFVPVESDFTRTDPHLETPPQDIKNSLEMTDIDSPSLDMRTEETNLTKLLAIEEKVRGVCFCRSDRSWTAWWTEKGRNRKKAFKLSMYGNAEAKRLAIDYRRHIEERLPEIRWGKFDRRLNPPETISKEYMWQESLAVEDYPSPAEDSLRGMPDLCMESGRNKEKSIRCDTAKQGKRGTRKLVKSAEEANLKGILPLASCFTTETVDTKSNKGIKTDILPSISPVLVGFSKQLLLQEIESEESPPAAALVLPQPVPSSLRTNSSFLGPSLAPHSFEKCDSCVRIKKKEKGVLSDPPSSITEGVCDVNGDVLYPVYEKPKGSLATRGMLDEAFASMKRGDKRYNLRDTPRMTIKSLNSAAFTAKFPMKIRPRRVEGSANDEIFSHTSSVGIVEQPENSPRNLQRAAATSLTSSSSHDRLFPLINERIASESSFTETTAMPLCRTDARSDSFFSPEKHLDNGSNEIQRGDPPPSMLTDSPVGLKGMKLYVYPSRTIKQEAGISQDLTHLGSDASGRLYAIEEDGQAVDVEEMRAFCFCGSPSSSAVSPLQGMPLKGELSAATLAASYPSHFPAASHEISMGDTTAFPSPRYGSPSETSSLSPTHVAMRVTPMVAEDPSLPPSALPSSFSLAQSPSLSASPRPLFLPGSDTNAPGIYFNKARDCLVAAVAYSRTKSGKKYKTFPIRNYESFDAAKHEAILWQHSMLSSGQDGELRSPNLYSEEYTFKMMENSDPSESVKEDSLGSPTLQDTLPLHEKGENGELMDPLSSEKLSLIDEALEFSQDEKSKTIRGISYSAVNKAWCAQWCNSTGSACLKSFSVSKYGYEGAKNFAILHRKQLEASGHVGSRIAGVVFRENAWRASWVDTEGMTQEVIFPVGEGCFTYDTARRLAISSRKHGGDVTLSTGCSESTLRRNARKLLLTRRSPPTPQASPSEGTAVSASETTADSIFHSSYAPPITRSVTSASQTMLLSTKESNSNKEGIPLPRGSPAWRRATSTAIKSELRTSTHSPVDPSFSKLSKTLTMLPSKTLRPCIPSRTRKASSPSTLKERNDSLNTPEVETRGSPMGTRRLAGGRKKFCLSPMILPLARDTSTRKAEEKSLSSVSLFDNQPKRCRFSEGNTTVGSNSVQLGPRSSPFWCSSAAPSLVLKTSATPGWTAVSSPLFRESPSTLRLAGSGRDALMDTSLWGITYNSLKSAFYVSWCSPSGEDEFKAFPVHKGEYNSVKQMAVYYRQMLQEKGYTLLSSPPLKADLRSTTPATPMSLPALVPPTMRLDEKDYPASVEVVPHAKLSPLDEVIEETVSLSSPYVCSFPIPPVAPPPSFANPQEILPSPPPPLLEAMVHTAGEQEDSLTTITAVDLCIPPPSTVVSPTDASSMTAAFALQKEEPVSMLDEEPAAAATDSEAPESSSPCSRVLLGKGSVKECWEVEQLILSTKSLLKSKNSVSSMEEAMEEVERVAPASTFLLLKDHPYDTLEATLQYSNSSSPSVFQDREYYNPSTSSRFVAVAGSGESLYKRIQNLRAPCTDSPITQFH
ncbi:hypothetical protein IE077_001342 [Cardiosporidium cionae]|uniref:AP2/ERF domain-containing protein n=1 Tax=Cardiosporidium cionae TaxID=476202 RepID=A0ABQ7J5I3_9APIC|nr:hypothetical protein IE077_001342 [Cardiosporidium cionae]|eukprot:KAF8819242.1 hypothetical protein IE077_001342 [Cardiosporidium cionae]